MLASTPDKAILRYLYLRERENQPKRADLETILGELKLIDDEHGGLYGFGFYGPVWSESVQRAVRTLEDHYHVIYEDENPHVTLTTLGRLQACELHFTDDLESIMPHKILHFKTHPIKSFRH